MNPYLTIETLWKEQKLWQQGIFPGIVNHREHTTPWMREESERGQIDGAIYQANQIIEKGCESFVEFLVKAAGLGLSTAMLKDVWEEHWSDMHEYQEENRLMDND